MEISSWSIWGKLLFWPFCLIGVDMIEAKILFAWLYYVIKLLYSIAGFMVKIKCDCK